MILSTPTPLMASSLTTASSRKVCLASRAGRYSLLLRRLCDVGTAGFYSPPLAIAVREWSSWRAQGSVSGPGDRLCNVCHLCDVLPESLFTKAERDIRQADLTLRATMDCICGFVLGIILYTTLSQIAGTDGSQSLISSYFSIIRGGIEWLGRFPVGFKLNERLTERMGEMLLSLLNLNEAMTKGVAQWVVGWKLWSLNSVLLPATSCVFGASGVVALLVDLIHLGTFQLFALSYLYRRLYRLELYLLCALWYLLRGKKKNLLRNRSDTMQYDSTQLLLGTVLFTIVTALLTTVFVYHLFFAVSTFTIDFSLLPFYLLLLALLRLPVGEMLINRRSSYFIDDLKLVFNTQQGFISFVDVTSLVPVKRSTFSMIKSVVSPALAAIGSRIAREVGGWFTGSPRPTSPFPVGPVLAET
jgi:hypothetical protein